jgi:hypothetical protein
MLEGSWWDGRRQGGSLPALGDLVVEWPEIGKGGVQEFLFLRGQIALGLDLEHFERIENASGSFEIHFLFACDGMRKLTEKEPGILGLKKEELIESRIGSGHGMSIEIPIDA